MVYSLRTDTVKDEEDNEFTVYGIDVKSDDENLKSYSDIFFDIGKAEEFVKFCKRNTVTIELLDILVQQLFE